MKVSIIYAIVAAPLDKSNGRVSIPRLFLSIALGIPVLAAAQHLPQCALPEVTSTPRTLDEDAIRTPIEISADRADITGAKGSVLSGTVEVKQGERNLVAEKIEYDAQSQGYKVSGNVQYTDPELEVTGDTAEFEAGASRAIFTNATFNYPAGPARGSASKFELREDRTISLTDVTYTACPKGKDDWELVAGQIELNSNEGKAVARNVKMKFKNVPFLYLPYFSFPLSGQRKSGLLAPDFGNSDRNGTNIMVPIYWNIAPERDATIAPRWLSKRGLQHNGEFRYLTSNSAGILTGEYLKDDDIVNADRYFANITHITDFSDGWRFITDISDASDSQYFEDFRRGSSSTSTTHLERNVQINYFSDTWTLLTRVQDFQTIDDTIAQIDEPYQRLPQLLIHGAWPGHRSGIEYGVTTEITNFDRDVGVTGVRFTIEPEVSYSYERNGFFAVPRVAMQHTQYDLDNFMPGFDDSPTVTAPIMSFDTGLIFERDTGSESALVQTLEPRLFYAYIPFRDQAGNPVFDTIEPDFNFVDLFRENRFVGMDRVGDTNRVAVGLTTRLFDRDSGAEILRASIGQAVLFGNENVVLPGMLPETDDSSDLLAELGLNWSGVWRAAMGYEYDPHDSETERAEIRFDYRPPDSKLFSVAYRFRRNLVDQGDVAFSWPMANRWNVVLRWTYDFVSKETIDELVGVEYRGCCWGLQLLASNNVATRDGDTDQSFVLRFELTGLTSIGDPEKELFQRGILGYR